MPVHTSYIEQSRVFTNSFFMTDACCICIVKWGPALAMQNSQRLSERLPYRSIKGGQLRSPLNPLIKHCRDTPKYSGESHLGPHYSERRQSYRRSFSRLGLTLRLRNFHAPARYLTRNVSYMFCIMCRWISFFVYPKIKPEKLFTSENSLQRNDRIGRRKTVGVSINTCFHLTPCTEKCFRNLVNPNQIWLVITFFQ